jgi:hypothetical protein
MIIMAKTFLPTTDSGLDAWADNIIVRVGADPSVYGVAQSQYDDFEALALAYKAAYNAARYPETRTQALVHAKNDSRHLLRKAANRLALVIYGQPDISNEQLSQLGLTVRDIEPSPSPIPPQPIVSVESVNGRLVTVLIQDSENPSRRGRPPYTLGTLLYSHVGEEMPATVEGWRQEGITGHRKAEILFPATVQPGAKVWITAQFFNGRKETGPAADPVTTTIGFSNVQAA